MPSSSRRFEKSWVKRTLRPTSFMIWGTYKETIFRVTWHHIGKGPLQGNRHEDRSCETTRGRHPRRHHCDDARRYSRRALIRKARGGLHSARLNSVVDEH